MFNMNLFSILFCFSMACVLIIAEKDNHQNSLHHIQEKNHKVQSRHGQSHLKQPLLDRAGSERPLDCRWVCVPVSYSSGTTLEIVINGNSSLIGILNKSTNIGIVIDSSSQLVALLNGKDGSGIIINLRTGSAYKITYNSQSEKYLWLYSTKSFNTYINSLSSLKNLYDYAEKNGQKINIEEISSIFNQFGIHLPSKEVFHLLVSFVKQLQGNLRLLYQGNGSFTIDQTLFWFLSLNTGFGDLLNSANGNLGNSSVWKRLILKSIFNASSGAEAFLNLFSQIGKDLNLASIFSSYFSSPQKWLTLLEQLSGGSNNGLDGYITIILSIIEAIENNGSISKVISSIINYNASANGDNDALNVIINEVIHLAESQVSKYTNSSSSWAFPIKILQSIINQNCVLRNVNISEIIKLLRWNNSSELISTIFKILPRFLPSHGIPQFFNFIVHLFNNTNSSELINRLFPGIDLRNLTGSGNLLQQIFRGHNLTELFSHPGEIAALLSHIPVFGQIIQRISQACGNFLNVSTIIKEFQNVFGGSGGFSNFFDPSVIEHVVQGFGNGVQQIFSSITGTGGSGGLPGLSSILGGGQAGEGNPSGGLGGGSSGGGVNGLGGGELDGGFDFDVKETGSVSEGGESRSKHGSLKHSQNRKGSHHRSRAQEN